MDTETVYEVARWTEVFETAESRKYKRLPWISERVDFDSTGWQQGLDDFGPDEWLRVYGAWMVIVRTAATAKVRGRLCGDKGEPWSPARIARPAGVDPGLIAQAMQWAIKIGWLLPVDPAAIEPPEESSGNLPERRENIIATERNGTVRNVTARNGTPRSPAAEPSRPILNSEKQPQTGRSWAAVIAARPELKQLQSEPVRPAAAAWISGSIWDRQVERQLKATFARGDKLLWSVLWYQGQLTAPKPLLNGGNAAEAALVLASAYACQRIAEGKVKTSRWALWSRWLKDRDASQVTDTDVQNASAAILRLISKRTEKESADVQDFEGRS